MQKAIIGKKVGMTQVFDSEGRRIPVTVIEAGPCTVIQKKTADKDGYDALQLGFEEISDKKLNRPESGVFKKAGVSAVRYLREARLDDCSAYNVGDVIKTDVFAEGDKVDITGTSKGKGFQGVIKRWGHHRLKMTHGTGPVHRSVGSTGANTDPSRVMPGLEMPGHMGAARSTVMNLSVVAVDAEKNLLAVKGAVPGPKGTLLVIRNSAKQ